jgi:hypothetical protein
MLAGSSGDNSEHPRGGKVISSHPICEHGASVCQDDPPVPSSVDNGGTSADRHATGALRGLAGTASPRGEGGRGPASPRRQRSPTRQTSGVLRKRTSGLGEEGQLAVMYVCKVVDKRGKFLPDKAKALGVRPCAPSSPFPFPQPQSFHCVSSFHLLPSRLHWLVFGTAWETLQVVTTPACAGEQIWME